MTTTNRSRNHRNNPYAFDSHRGPVSPHRCWGALWRWRTELAIISTAVAGALWLLCTLFTFTATGLAITALILTAARCSGCHGHPPIVLARRRWCVISRHRLQRLCFEARLHTRSEQAAAHPPNPPHQSRRTRSPLVPGRYLPGGRRRAKRRNSRRLLRPRCPRRPQHALVPAHHCRHHPPRPARRKPPGPCHHTYTRTRPERDTETGHA